MALSSCVKPVKVAEGVFLPCVRLTGHQGPCKASYWQNVAEQVKPGLWSRLRRKVGA